MTVTPCACRYEPTTSLAEDLRAEQARHRAHFAATHATLVSDAVARVGSIGSRTFDGYLERIKSTVEGMAQTSILYQTVENDLAALGIRRVHVE